MEFKQQCIVTDSEISVENDPLLRQALRLLIREYIDSDCKIKNGVIKLTLEVLPYK